VPVISVFFGIVVRLFHDDHNPPHFHVEYGERRAVIEIATGFWRDAYPRESSV